MIYMLNPDDPVGMYIREVAVVEPLSREEEMRLFRELGGSSDWDDQRENVARRLIESNLRLVVEIARRHSAEGRPMLDLIQEGNMGLMNAVKTFSEDPTGDFTSHAAACIETAIVQVLAKPK